MAKIGQQFGKWIIAGQLGEGGNGRVWSVTSQACPKAAIKFLKNPDNELSNKRFRNEIAAMQACKDIAGVLPILDFYMPENPSAKDPAWFVSTYSAPLDDAPEPSRSLKDAVTLIAELARTLAAMHSRGYFHRDIKPPPEASASR